MGFFFERQRTLPSFICATWIASTQRAGAAFAAV